jgi:multiple sugar transport system ATP-binding protein
LGDKRVAGVRFDGVWKYYGDVPAVTELNLEIKEGEFLVLVGPSGCGKTTSLRMLGGLETPSYGRIWMRDRDVTLVPPGSRDIAMVFQSYALYPHMTVYKNLSFGPSVRRESKKDTEARIHSVAEILGVQKLLHRRPSELSGGQRQRVALGRAMIRQPKLFLLDEPLSNLDAALRVQMRTELLRLHKLLPVTTVYVTHDQVEALTMGDRVAVFDQGSLLQVGSPNELYNNPRTLFVAEFIGSPKINLIDSEVAGLEADGVTVRLLDQTVTIRGRKPTAGLAVGDALQVGVRPHDLVSSEESPARCTVSIPATVDILEHTGSELFVVGGIGREKGLMARFHRTTAVAVGDRVTFTLDPNDLHVFHSETGESIFGHQMDPRPMITPASRQPRQLLRSSDSVPQL